MSYPRLAFLLFFFPLLACLLRADWKENTGFNRLQQTFTTGVPVTVADGLTQAEAPDGTNYAPDTTSPLFSGYTFVLKSGDSSANGHAQAVASYFYGNSTSYLSGPASVDLYNANNWLNAGFLRFGEGVFPNIEPRRVQNHSWIVDGGLTDAQATHANLRLDYAINRDGFTSVVGVNNGASTVLPALLAQGYHSVSVGLVSGNHSAGLTAFDTAGRMKPDLVTFENLTSFATPQVAGAAAVISEKLRLTYSPALVTADYPRLTKALLLAGAAKEPLPAWSRADPAKPYDAVFGAGALNLLLSYRILSAGPATFSDNTAVPPTAWSVASVGGNQPANRTRTYFFDIPAGPPVPFSAALVWHRAIDNSLVATFSNLDLQLRSVTADTFTVGTVIDASTSTVDNVEHLYQPALAPGRYALQVTHLASPSTAYALAWRTSPAVAVAATTPVAREIDSSPAVFTVTRTGPVTSPLLVPLSWSGTAVFGNHYSAPASVLIPAGQSSATVSATPVADFLAQGDRTLVLAVVTDYSLSADSPSSAQATLHDKPYDAWRFTRFTAEQLADPLVSGDSADPDADGTPNLLEYAFNGEPLLPDLTTPVAVSGLDANRLTLAYTRPAATTDLAYTVEWSGDLASWHTGPTFTETLSTTQNEDGTTTVVTRAVPDLSASPRQFLRLRVTR